MRNIFMLCAACAFAVTASAQPRSDREMKAIAAEHFYGSTATARSLSGEATQLQQLLTTDMVAAYTDNSGACVFVSRDAAFAPVLGWTDNPSQLSALNSQLPDGLRWWLSTISQVMHDKLVSHDLETLNPVAAQATNVQPLLSSRWSQDAPFNDKCPVVDSWTGNRAQTGCVATAMAQTLRYHRHPAQGTGTGYYTQNGGSKQNKRIQTTYDWTNMKDSYPTYTSKKDETTEAVSALMYDCGLAAGMNYMSQQSGATTLNAAKGLTTNLGYDSRALHCHYRLFATDVDWLQTIYSELQQQRPVIYASTDATYGAHSFVIDGCRQSDGYLHVNWGWGGDADGYFDFFNLNPTTAYLAAYGMSGYNFSLDVESQSMLFGITPAGGSVDYPHEAYWTLAGEEVISVEGDSITLQLPTLINYHFETFSGLIGLCIENVATGHAPIQPFYYTAWGGAPVPSLSGWNEMEIPYYKYVTDELKPGQYDLYLMAWQQDAIGKTMPQYVRFPATNNGKENYNIWRMTKHDDGHLSIAKRDLAEGTATGIRDNNRETINNNRFVYDLSGRRITGASHGMRIVDGKKILK